VTAATLDAARRGVDTAATEKSRVRAARAARYLDTADRHS